MDIDDSNNFVITGSFTDSTNFNSTGQEVNLYGVNNSQDVFLAKYETNGNNIWAKSFGSSSFDFGRSLGIHNNDIYLAGTFSGDITINSLGGNTLLTCGGLGDIFLTKFNSDGENIWALSIEGMENDAWYSALSMSVDESGAIYITGDHIGAADFNPTNEENILTPSGISDLYIASYSPDGNYNWAMQTGSELDEVGFSLDVDDFGTIYLTGYFYGTCDFDPTEELMNVQSHGNADIFFAKYSQPTNFIHNENKLIPNKMVLLPAYPNPFNPTTTIRFNIPLESSASRLMSLQIFDITGRVVKTLVDDFVQPGAHETQWDASDQASGVYFVWLESGTVVQTQKIVLVK